MFFRMVKQQFWVKPGNFNGRYAMQDHNWKISASKTKFWVHSTRQNFQNCHFSRVKIRMLLVKNQSFEMYSTIRNTMKYKSGFNKIKISDKG